MNASTTANKGANRWYGLYKHLRGSKGGATSTMIWGCQYDQVINFIGVQAQIGHSTWNLANNINDTVSGTHQDDKMKNIYDLEGNYVEWTAQGSSSFNRTGKGGYYDLVSYSNFVPASVEGWRGPTKADEYFGSRSTLYM